MAYELHFARLSSYGAGEVGRAHAADTEIDRADATR